MYNSYKPTTWKEDGTSYGADCFNNIENGIVSLETLVMYRQKQAKNLAKAMKKLRMNQDVKIAMRGDSVMFGYNTITGGEDGRRRYKNDVVADGGDDGAMRDRAKADGYDGCFYFGDYPLRRTDGSREILGNNNADRTEVQPMDVMIQCLNEVYEGHITYVDKVFTGDSAIINYYRYNASGADVCLCNLGINDALASFLGKEYVGNVDEFVYWYTKLMEREIDNGTAFVIVTPVLQTTVSTYDTDMRSVVDVYEKTLYDLGRMYGVPVLNGNEFNHNFPNSLIIDFTHCNCEGNESIGKRLAAPFVAGDLSNYSVVEDLSSLGVRPQEDSINVYGDACIDYTEKAFSYPSMLDNNDLYDTGVNRVAKGLGVFMNYPLNGTVKDIYDKSLLEADTQTLESLNSILSTVWEDSDAKSTKEEAVDEILLLQDDYIFNQISDINILWRQADLYARGKGVRGSDTYKNAYTERMAFLQKKHGYDSETATAKNGKVTWAFYCAKDSMIVVPSLYAPGDAEITMELDFASIVPEKAGYFLNFIPRKDTTEAGGNTTQGLESIATELEIVYSDAVSDADLRQKIKEKLGYDVAASCQGSPNDAVLWNTSSDELHRILTADKVNEIYETAMVSGQEAVPSTSTINFSDGENTIRYSGVAYGIASSAISIVSKGWHTITIYSPNKDPFIAFGLTFLNRNLLPESMINALSGVTAQSL